MLCSCAGGAPNENAGLAVTVVEGPGVPKLTVGVGVATGLASSLGGTGAGGAPKENPVGGLTSAGLASVLFSDLPESATDPCEVGVVNVIEGRDDFESGAGALLEGTGGAGNAAGSDFFGSSIFSRILAIAAASMSCFSHFEKVR